MRKSSHPYYPDIIIFLVIIPIISAINYYLTYSGIRLNGFLILTFSIDTITGYIAWWVVRSLILFLDMKVPYSHGALKRIAIQICITTALGLLTISLLTEMVSWIARGRPAPLNFYLIDLFIIGIWFFVINGIYIGLFYYNEWRWSEIKLLEERRVKSSGIVVKHGKSDLQLEFTNLSGFYVDGEYTVACKMDGKKYYLDQSLQKIEKSIPSTVFFRLNRQFIIHRQMVSGFKRLENGKLSILLKQHASFPPEVTVSRIKAPDFKTWFRPG
jgi:hypothetical protein